VHMGAGEVQRRRVAAPGARDDRRGDGDPVHALRRPRARRAAGPRSRSVQADRDHHAGSPLAG
jgi:hypothetical protein